MADREVGRTPRTMVPLRPLSPPAGVTALMPPHSQGAERRTERRARHAGLRWGVRVLVIGGLAGVAWLLTGAAAHAADRDPEPSGPGLLGSVLQAAVQPLESEPAHHQYDSAALLDAPVRVLTRPVAALTKDQDALDGVGRVVREITGPLRLTGGPADSSLAGVTDRLTTPLRRITGILPNAAVPIRPAPRPAPVAGSVPESPPGGDGPAPQQGCLGAINGVPAAGSGTGTEGGSAALLPATIADGSTAYRRLSNATDVDVRRHVAEAPTVSPD